MKWLLASLVLFLPCANIDDTSVVRLENDSKMEQIIRQAGPLEVLRLLRPEEIHFDDVDGTYLIRNGSGETHAVVSKQWDQMSSTLNPGPVDCPSCGYVPGVTPPSKPRKRYVPRAPKILENMLPPL
jgi:hypothetical protein